jgi:hypothetical protein
VLLTIAGQLRALDGELLAIDEADVLPEPGTFDGYPATYTATYGG